MLAIAACSAFVRSRWEKGLFRLLTSTCFGAARYALLLVMLFCKLSSLEELDPVAGCCSLLGSLVIDSSRVCHRSYQIYVGSYALCAGKHIHSGSRDSDWHWDS